MIGLKYTGRKAMPYEDRIFGTGFVWQDKETVVWMENPVAAQFLRHPDIFERVAGDPPKKAQVQEPLVPPTDSAKQHEKEEEVENLPPLVQLDGMDRKGLVEFAQRHFGQRLHHSMTEENMRNRIRNWMNSPVVAG